MNTTLTKQEKVPAKIISLVGLSKPVILPGFPAANIFYVWLYWQTWYRWRLHIDFGRADKAIFVSRFLMIAIDSKEPFVWEKDYKKR